MAKHFGIGMLTAILMIIIQYVFINLLESPYLYAIVFVSLFFGMLATCTSMILDKLDTLLELTASQSAKLRSLEAKKLESKASSHE